MTTSPEPVIVRGGCTVLPGMELMNCPNLAVPMEVMHHVVRVESSYNPYAIGVVGGRLVRQPKSLSEALATVRMLESRGYNFSLGLAQVNRHNLRKYGLDSYEKAFQACPNLQAGSRILAECYGRSGGDWGKSFSCYYSGDFSTGFRHGYVQKVYTSIRESRNATAGQPTAGLAIEVVNRPSRRVVGVSRLPAESRVALRSLPAAASQAAAPRPTSRLAAAMALQPDLPAATTPVPAPTPVPPPVPEAATTSTAPRAVRVSITHPRGSPGAAVFSGPDVDRAFVF